MMNILTLSFRFRTNKEVYGTSPMFGIHCALHDDDQIGLEINVNDKVENF